MRRFHGLCLALGALLLAVAATAQDATGPRLLIEPDRDVAQALVEARQAIGKKQYHSAVLLLQGVLDQPEDFFVERSFSDDLGNRGGTRRQVLQLLMSMPADGQAAYELEYGATARNLFDAAAQSGDLAAMAEVVRRFAATSAGYDATISLAAHAFDAGLPLEAALLLDSLRGHSRRTPQLSVMRAVYWTRAGRAERGFAALRELKRSGSVGKIRIGGEDVALPLSDDDARKLIQASAVQIVTQPNQVPFWSMSGGGPSRNSSAISASPVGGNIWQVSTLAHLTLDGREAEDRGHRARFQQVLQKIAHGLQEENQIAIPASQPLVVGDTVVYRTLGDVTAVSLRTGELLWRSALVDEGLVRLMNTRVLEARGRMSRFGMPQPVITLEGHLERRTYRDQAAGTLSSDGHAVFALEDLDSIPNTFALVGSASNKLVAYDLAGGRMLWEVGGPRGSKPPELSAQFFLGPPLPLDDKLYVLSEGHGAVQLLVLKQDADRQAVQLEWLQTLIPADIGVTAQPMRRLSGLSPSYSDGMLICPTSSGFVVAMDLARRALAWGFQYPSLVKVEPRRGNFMVDPSVQSEQQLEETEKSARWIDSNPVIADGRVLITPRDSDRLFCLDLVDGHELWQIPREDWLYVASIVDGNAILVGRHGVGAVQMSDGEHVDSYRTVVQPTGRGVRNGNSYYLPTASGEIATLDLRTGKIIARSKLMGSLVPGNLAAGGGAIVSQSANEVVGFSPLPAIELRIASQLKIDPHDPQALALRGELRLHRGEEAAGLADLRESLQGRPDPYVKSVLAAALLASLRSDSTNIRERVAELELITDDPQQKNEFLLLYTRVLEAAGDHRTAFAQMIRLAENSQFLDTLETIEPRYFARTDRSIRSRLIETYQATPSGDRSELDKILEQHILSAVEPAHVEQLQRCWRFFSGLPKVDSVLLKLTMEMKGIEEPERQELLRSFMRSGDPQVAAQATSLRCREVIQANLWPEAARLITRLRTQFADQECLEGKTGKSLADEWAVRDELQALLKPPVVWAPGEIEFTRTQRPRQRQIPAEILSRFGSAMAGWSFETNLGGNILTARNAFGIVRWNLALPNDVEFHENGGRSGVSSQVQIYDNWLAVTHNGHFAVVDASSTTPRVAWQQSLRIPGTPNDDWTRLQRMRMGLRTNPQSGRVLALTRETVIYSVGTKLLANELETGRLVWSREDLPFLNGSADDRIVAIEANGSTTILRTLDGAVVSRRPQEKGTLLWTRGSQQFVLVSKADATTFELRDHEHGVVTWSRDSAKNSLATIIDDEDVAILEPTGQLVVLRLGDGRERYQATLPITLPSREKSNLVVQRNGDFDLIMSGETYRHRDHSVIAFETEGTQVPIPFDGNVSAVSHDKGQVLWTRQVERVAFDPTQPASLPVLLLASRRRETPANTPFGYNSPYRMTAEVIDKRNGRQIYWTDESATPIFAPTMEPMPDSGHILINFPEWQLDLAVPGKIPVPQD
ncbi:MAG: PQQ-binding-like beta-propeller repeat protein [Planctomycetes bacterium]|nr:PQQ-binding-like beta-propeller repeat protein [Planctomycetota bacterium]